MISYEGNHAHAKIVKHSSYAVLIVVRLRRCLLRIASRTDASRDVKSIYRNVAAELQQAQPIRAPNTTSMANRGYDVVVDVDQEVCKHGNVFGSMNEGLI